MQGNSPSISWLLVRSIGPCRSELLCPFLVSAAAQQIRMLLAIDKQNEVKTNLSMVLCVGTTRTGSKPPKLTALNHSELGSKLVGENRVYMFPPKKKKENRVYILQQ